MNLSLLVIPPFRDILLIPWGSLLSVWETLIHAISGTPVLFFWDYWTQFWEPFTGTQFFKVYTHARPFGLVTTGVTVFMSQPYRSLFYHLMFSELGCHLLISLCAWTTFIDHLFQGWIMKFFCNNWRMHQPDNIPGAPFA